MSTFQPDFKNHPLVVSLKVVAVAQHTLVVFIIITIAIISLSGLL